MHRLLQRQVRQAGVQDGDAAVARLLEMVSEVYTAHELNRQRADRANELMAAELTDMLEMREHTRELENARAVAEAANAAKSQFLANMSHELRTPLNAIIGYAEIIAEDGAAPEKVVRADAQRIAAAGRHLLSLVNSVLDLSAIEVGKLSLSMVEVDLASLLHETAAILMPLAERNGNRLALEIDPGLPPCVTDPVRLRQCVLNLGANATKFTRDGAILIQATPMGEHVRIDVTDTGIGIGPGALPRLFQPFSQADESTTRHYGGTGLGLSLTRQLMDLLGGTVDVRSREGVGSTFTLSFPARLAEVAAA